MWWPEDLQHALLQAAGKRFVHFGPTPTPSYPSGFTAINRHAVSAASAAILVGSRCLHRHRGLRKVKTHVARVFEFFSGIGGMRAAFQIAKSPAAPWPSWRAMEIDETCVDVYSAIFGSGLFHGIREGKRWQYSPGQDEVWRCSIDKLPDEAFEGAELWLLSPPCQPFTRTGNKLDTKDPRSAAFMRLLEALPRLSNPPHALLLENVPEFIVSKARTKFRQALDRCKLLGNRSFEVEERILDPTDFGFPNTRKRYYCLAVASDPSSRRGDESQSTPVTLPGIDGPVVPIRPVRAFCSRVSRATAQRGHDLDIPQKLLAQAQSAGWQLDVATAETLATKTFTGSYGKPAYSGEGLSKAGPLLLTEATSPAPAEEQRKRFGNIPEEDWSRLRYFAPEEVLALQGFPEGWTLPSKVPTRDQWRLIGNSINVVVVGRLLERLLAKL